MPLVPEVPVVPVVPEVPVVPVVPLICATAGGTAAPARIERTSPAASASDEKLRRITIRNMFTTFSSEGSS